MATIDVPIREAINMALDEEMTRDENVFLIGESPACEPPLSSRPQARKLLNTKEPTRSPKVSTKSMARRE
jgi:hypothetical protein